MKRYRVDACIYDGRHAAVVGTPDDGGVWVRADDAERLRAELADLAERADRLAANAEVYFRLTNDDDCFPPWDRPWLWGEPFEGPP